MPIDLKSLKKLETLPFSEQQRAASETGPLVVLVKLHEGQDRPTYVSPRATIGPNLFSAEIDASDLERLEGDPAVESVSVSRSLPGIE